MSSHHEGESLGSHSLHSFAEFLQHHINSPAASSCLSSKRKPLKPLNVLKPFSLKFMAAEKSVRKGGRQRRGGTSKDLPDDLQKFTRQIPKRIIISARPESSGFEDIGQNSGTNTDS